MHNFVLYTYLFFALFELIPVTMILISLSFVLSGKSAVFATQYQESLRKIISMFENKPNPEPDLLPPFVGTETHRPDMSPLGNLIFVSTIARTSGSNVFEAVTTGSDKTVVVKYTTDCAERLSGSKEQMHPLEKEFVFLAVLNETCLVPATYYLSAESRISDHTRFVGRVMSDLLQLKFDACRNAGTTVRYMVQEKAGISIHDFFDRFQEESSPQEYIKSVINAGISMVYKLAQLHSKGIVHNDIHASNILLRSDQQDFVNVEWDDLVFIDFAYADFFPAYLGADKKLERPRSDLRRYVLSPWQLGGHRPGPRDDLYRAIQMVAHLLSHGELFRDYNALLLHELEIRGGPSKGSIEYSRIEDKATLWFKRNVNLFAPALSRSLYWSKTPDIFGKISKGFRHILTAARECMTPDCIPKYSSITAHLNEILSHIA